MFRIPSKVREELCRSGFCYTSRYEYRLQDLSEIEPGLVFCVRYRLRGPGWKTVDSRSDDIQRRLF